MRESKVFSKKKRKKKFMSNNSQTEIQEPPAGNMNQPKQTRLNRSGIKQYDGLLSDD